MRISWRAVGHRFRVVRIALGMSDQEAANTYGITLRTYRRYESGRPQRGSQHLVRFTEKYDVSLDWLILGEGSGVAKHIKGKIAILPVEGPFRRNARMRAA